MWALHPLISILFIYFFAYLSDRFVCVYLDFQIKFGIDVELKIIGWLSFVILLLCDAVDVLLQLPLLLLFFLLLLLLIMMGCHDFVWFILPLFVAFCLPSFVVVILMVLSLDFVAAVIPCHRIYLFKDCLVLLLLLLFLHFRWWFIVWLILALF